MVRPFSSKFSQKCNMFFKQVLVSYLRPMQPLLKLENGLKRS